MTLKRITICVLAALVALSVVESPVWGHEGHKKAEQAEQHTETPPPTPQHQHAEDDHSQAETQQQHEHSHSEPETEEERGHADDEESQPEEHDHSAHEHPGGGSLQIVAWLGKLHPPTTNFPIALLLVGALAELLYMRSGAERFRSTSHYCVLIGSLGAIAAATLGWFFAGFHLVDDDWVLTTHRWVGTTTALAAITLLFLLRRMASNPEERRAYRAVLFAAALLASAAGFFGGALLYGIDHYWSA